MDIWGGKGKPGMLEETNTEASEARGREQRVRAKMSLGKTVWGPPSIGPWKDFGFYLNAIRWYGIT